MAEKNNDHTTVILPVRLRIMSQILRERGLISMKDVIDTFGVARATAQRDLARLCSITGAQKTRGGVMLSEGSADIKTAIDFSVRETADIEAKTRIAITAAKCLAGSAALYIDAGTTTLYVAQEIVRSNWRPIWVVTNDWHIAEVLAQAGIRHELLGGEVDPHSLAISGATSIDTLSRFHFDWAVLSGDAITTDGSVRAALPPEAQLKKTALNMSSKSMLLAPAAKFGQSAHAEAAKLSDFDIWITDASDPRIDELCNEYNIELIVAK